MRSRFASLIKLATVGVAVGSAIGYLVHKELAQDPSKKYRDDPRYAEGNLASDIVSGGVFGGILLPCVGLAVGMVRTLARKMLGR